MANWLYGVAYRTALKARAALARHAARERQVCLMPEPNAPADDSWDRLEPVLDEELAGLPDKYRAALVLCDLEGQTGKQAAAQLRIPEGTLSSRLRTARRLLAQRLRRRGVVLSGGALAAYLARSAAAAPGPLMSATVRVAGPLAAGQVADGLVSPTVAALMEGVLKAMMVTKLQQAFAVLVIAGSLLGVALHPRGEAHPRGP